MKKMIVVAAVALVAGLTNAAMVNWNNPSGARITGIDGANITQANAKAWGLQAILVNTTTGEELTSYGSSSVSAIGKTAGVLSAPAYNYTYGDTVKNGDVLSVVLKMTVDGQSYELDTGLAMTVTATDNGGSDLFNNATAWGTSSYGGASGWAKAGGGGGGTDGPEPTSGLLLLVGAGILGLRRKRA